MGNMKFNVHTMLGNVYCNKHFSKSKSNRAETRAMFKREFT